MINSSPIVSNNIFMIRETRSFEAIGVKTHEVSIEEYMDIFKKRSECFSRIALKNSGLSL